MTMEQPHCRRTAWLSAGLKAGVMALSVALIAAFGAAQSPALAQMKGTINEGTVDPLRIAIPQLLPASAGDAEMAAQLTQVIAADLTNTGLFDSLDPAAFIEQIEDPNRAPRFADWKTINAQALLVGRVGRQPDGRVKVEFRLWDVVSGKQLAGQQFTGNVDTWRRLSHLVADQVYERLTANEGYFDTRIVYVDETGPKDKRIKKLAVMDQDGANARILTQGNELLLAPRFHPSNQSVVYTAYDKGGNPHVYIHNLGSGQRRTVGPQEVPTFAPRFSPDGSRVIMSGIQGGNTDIIEVDVASGQIRQLTNSEAIETGPSYSPDGAQIVFESDAEAGQQLYIMGADGSPPRRLSSGDGRYSTPVWSPKGDYIAFTKMMEGRFLIGVMKPDGSGERILTGGYHNEGPTWAPNGRVLMFFREGQGDKGGSKLFSVDITGYNERQVPTQNSGSDPAWSPRLR
jgi:TolB protein